MLEGKPSGQGGRAWVVVLMVPPPSLWEPRETSQSSPGSEVEGGGVLLATSPSHLGCKSGSPALKWPLSLKAYLLKLLAAQKKSIFLSHFLHLRKSLHANLKSMSEREHRNKRKVENVFDNFIEKYCVTPKFPSFPFFHLAFLLTSSLLPTLSLSTTKTSGKAARCHSVFHTFFYSHEVGDDHF